MVVGLPVVIVRPGMAWAFETLECRTLLASIAGHVFYDVMANGVNDGPDYGVAGRTVYLDANGNGAFDGNSASGASADLPKTIPDLSTVSSILVVAGIVAPVQRVTVTLSISHSYDSDLTAYLVSPAGTRVLLFAGVGGSGDHFVNTTLDDQATAPISLGNAPFSGVFRPQQALSVLSGQSANGTWMLELSDDTIGDVGKLTAWSLRFSTGERSEISDANGNYAITSLSAGTYDVRSLTPNGWTSTAPSGGVQAVTLVDESSIASAIDFGARQPPGVIRGSIWDDRSGDGVRQSSEPPLAGWTVYIDFNNNGKLDSNEMSAVTGGQGSFTFSNVPPGTHRLREVVQPGWIQTTNVAFATTSPLATPGPAKLTTPVVVATPVEASTASQLQGKFTKTEILVSVRGLDGLRTLNKALAARGSEAASRLVDLPGSKVLFSNARAGETLVQVQLRSGAEPGAAVARLKAISAVQWASPNYVYGGATKPDPREFTPNDPNYSDQYFHTLMQNNLAWNTTLGSSNIIVAITDDGFDINHPDLAANIWTNAGEIAGNGIDDDQNGYIDDVHGWNFSGNTNNVAGTFSAYHGNHVAGIVGARTNNGIGVAGTAGGVTIMPIRFFGTTPWTSAVVAASYAYAANNGAKIVNTSYGVDEFSSDPAYVAALQYIYDAGLLHLNSAGNTATRDPLRQSLDQSLFVVNTNAADAKSSTSNYGWGMDLTAPGESIYSTFPNGNYSYLSGTSMASANAAGAAALIWSAHPTWTRDQVAAQLIGTTDNIAAQNPFYAADLGSGRVNSYRAVTESLRAPRLKSVLGLPAQGGVSNNLITAFTVDVANVFDAATVSNITNWELRWAGADKTFSTADDRLIPISLLTNYMIGTNRLGFSIDASLTAGYYKFSATAGLRDPFGQSIDGNGDGIGGDPFVRSFSINGVSTPIMVTVASGQETSGADFGNRYYIRTDNNGKGDEDGEGNGGDPNPTGTLTTPNPGTAPNAGTSPRLIAKPTASSSVDRLFSDVSILAGLKSA
ncbi:hypothetical protein BH09PLA1_BH09PLA1_13790 [soil metagenome]